MQTSVTTQHASIQYPERDTKRKFKTEEKLTNQNFESKNDKCKSSLLMSLPTGCNFSYIGSLSQTVMN